MKYLLVLIIVLRIFHIAIGDSIKFDFEAITLPYKIDSFPYSFHNKGNQIEYYNSKVTEGVGFYRNNGKYRKQTAIYLETSNKIIGKKKVNKEIIEYQLKDSSIVNVIGQVLLNDKYNCLLISISEANSLFQKPYFIKVICFDKEDNHLSTINVLEIIDDFATMDWLKEKNKPNTTSIIKESGEIIVTWDEGNDVCEQFVELNDHGIFVETKLRFHNRKKFYEGNRNDYREVRNLNDLNFYK